MANIKVAVRVRPISERELNFTGSKIVVRAQSNEISLTNLKVSSWKTGDSRERIKTYGFDYCFDSSNSETENYATQAKIYETLGESVLDSVFTGYNACLVAYGQSSTGKTYTMMGSKDDPGLTPRLCKGIFTRITQEEDNAKTYQVFVSYLEIYNERVRDLLKPRANASGLRVREHPRLGPYVQGLTRHKVSNLGSLMSYVEEGIKARKTASTLQNPNSSRSHALLTVSLAPVSPNNHSATATAKEKDFHRGSKLHLVDLAGSESAATCSGIHRLKEGANINKSLVALGNVISALAERGSSGNVPGRRFIPYRDSSLTWLLKDALGGNATTIMFATISPASGSYNETAHTLRFAQRAQSVVNRPVVNEDPIARIIRELRTEVARLKSLLLEKELGGFAKSPCSCGHNLEAEFEKEDQKDEQVVPLTRISSSRLLGEPKEIIKPSIRRYNSNECLVTRDTRPSNSIRKCGSFESISPSISFANEGRSYRSEPSEPLNYQVNEPVFVDIPTLVAVLIKPENSSQVHSTQIEEVCNDGLLEGLIDTKLFNNLQDLSSENDDLSTIDGNLNKIVEDTDVLTKIDKDFVESEDFTNRKDNIRCSDDNHEIHEINTKELGKNEIVNLGNVVLSDLNTQVPTLSEKTKKEKTERPKEKGKLRKQDSVDSRKRNNLNTSRIFGSVDGLSKRKEEPLIRSPTNLENRANSEKSKRLNNIKEVEDRRPKGGNYWRGLVTPGNKELQRKWSNDSDRSQKETHKTKNPLRKYSIDDLKRKTSKDSSSSSSKEDQLISSNYSRKSSFQDQDRPHTPIQRNRRAEIVAAVTERLYSSGKRSDEGTGATTPVSDYRSPESTDVKLAAVTRMRLQEISRRMLAKRRKISADTQTDNTQTVRVKDKASLTDEPKIVQKDAEVLTDEHEVCERLSHGHQVLRVKERATLTEKQKTPTVRYRDAGNITDDCDEDFDLHSPRNDSGILSDDTQNYADSNISETLDFGEERRSTESSTNTVGGIETSVDGTAQTRPEDLRTKENDCCHRLHECCYRRHSQKHEHKSTSGSESSQTNENGSISSNQNLQNNHIHCQKQNCKDKSVISINLPDMINITIESPNILESRISVADEEELRTNYRDREVQTEERRIFTEDINRYYNTRPSQTDGRTFRIENIFQEPKTIRITPDSRITNRIRIVSSIEDPKMNFTKTIGTSGQRITSRRCLSFHSPLKSLRRKFSLIRDRPFTDSYFSRRSRSFSPHCRTPFVTEGFRNRYPSSEMILNPVQEVLLERGLLFPRNQIWSASRYFRTTPGEMNLFNGRRFPNVDNELRKDSYFSDDSLDLMEEKSVEDPCQPDLVAHTKESSKITENKVPDAVENLETIKKKKVSFSNPSIVDNQSADQKLPQTPKPIIKKKISSVDSNSPDDEEPNTSIAGISEMDEKISKELEKNSEEESLITDRDEPTGGDIPAESLEDNGENSTECEKDSTVAEGDKTIQLIEEQDPEDQERRKEEEEVQEFEESGKTDELEEKKSVGPQNILQDYLDEAVTFIRNVHSVNDYATATNFLKKYLRSTRGSRRLPQKSRDYVEYAGEKISLTDDTDQYLLDENIEVPNKAYEKCLQGIEKLEKCIEKVKDHEVSLKEKYGIGTEPAGAKHVLANSNQDLLGYLDNDNDSDDNILNSDVDENDTYRNSNSVRGNFQDIDNDNYNWSYRHIDPGLFPSHQRSQFSSHMSNSQIGGNYRLSNSYRSKYSNQKSKTFDNFENYLKENKSSRTTKNFPSSKTESFDRHFGRFTDFDDSERNCSRLSKISPLRRYGPFNGTFRVDDDDDDVLGKKWKSPASFRHSSLPRLTSSSNESFSSSETIAASLESIDSVSNVREQIKYPGSPRAKFLQLLNERRRIVENSRRGNKS
ncbi:kinesin-like protein KIF16B [Leptopilina heterotoma]|uniref:kinesin-like protein KIF16B n=1 Tax=Leptopilina heterotoma TaxID=63436 RepID=UPI001CAA1B7E|nr:kinesin-like protein KIF16B [Leptopilina heterotoma]XP_043484714.1 kinesin-like protein KIF16B [Leptopilina heterotoma]